MLDEMTAKFLPRFAELSRERLRKAFDVARARHYGSATAVMRDMHALAGEAGLLGLGDVLAVARQAEEAARRFGATKSAEDADGLLARVQELERVVAAMVAQCGG